MEHSQIELYQGLTFLAWATGAVIIVVAGFLAKLLFDLSKLTRNLDETTTVIKAEVEPALVELNEALKTLNSIAKNADKQVDILKKSFDGMLSITSLAFLKAKNLSGGLVKGLSKGFFTIVKMFLKK